MSLTYVIVMNTVSLVIVLMHHCLGHRVLLNSVRKIKPQIGISEHHFKLIQTSLEDAKRMCCKSV